MNVFSSADDGFNSTLLFFGFDDSPLLLVTADDVPLAGFSVTAAEDAAVKGSANTLLLVVGCSVDTSFETA